MGKSERKGLKTGTFGRVALRGTNVLVYVQDASEVNE